MAVEAQKVLRQALEVAAREVSRLAGKEALEGWDAANLQRYVDICVRADDHELKWMSKLDPSKLPEELVQRVLRATEEEASDGRAKRKPRAGA